MLEHSSARRGRRRSDRVLSLGLFADGQLSGFVCGIWRRSRCWGKVMFERENRRMRFGTVARSREILLIRISSYRATGML
jgi:hypothetical protein